MYDRIMNKTYASICIRPFDKKRLNLIFTDFRKKTAINCLHFYHHKKKRYQIY